MDRIRRQSRLGLICQFLRDICCMDIRPRRSVLYMPGANVRAMQKAKELSSDALIFDLEDSVSVDSKSIAARQVFDMIESVDYGYRELIVRVNHIDSEWGSDEIATFARAKVDALLFPKVERVDDLTEILSRLDRAGGGHIPVWIMVETAKAVLNIERLVSYSDRINCLVMGTTDLINEVRGQHETARSNLSYSLQKTLLAARAFGLDAIDGVHLDFKDLSSFREICQQGKIIGYDGKTLIHPSQIDIANDVFGYSSDEIERAEQIIDAWEKAESLGKGVAVVDGQLIESLHVESAKRIRESYRIIELRTNAD